MTLGRIASLVIVVAACGGGNKPAPQPPAAKPDPIAHTPGPACKAVADHMAITIGDHKPDQPDGDVYVRAAYEKRCDADAWTDEARSCLATMESAQEVDGCMSMLTKPQQRALADDQAKLGKAAAPESPPVTPAKSHTRGPIKKDKGASKTSDPCEGGE